MRDHRPQPCDHRPPIAEAANTDHNDASVENRIVVEVAKKMEFSKRPQSVPSQPERREVSFYERSLMLVGRLRGVLGTLCCCLCAPYARVDQGFFGVISRFGRFDRIVEPGLTYLQPGVETLVRIDTRLKSLSLEKQNVLTKDNISVHADVIIVYRIVDVQIACFAVQDLTALLQQKAYATIRSIFGTRPLQELLEKRVEIADDVRALVEKDAQRWGVHIEAINIKDLIIPHEMIAALSAV